jgi:predicted dehydrogenase
MGKLQVAVIGCGNIACAAHIPNYMKNEDAEIRYFCDIVPRRADRQVTKHGCGKAVYDYKEILNDPDLDMVSVCTHNDTHASISIDFLRAGKHVLCEKPAARTYPEALEMRRAARETGKLLSIGVVNRFGENVNRIKKMIADGDLGEVYHVAAKFCAERAIPGIGGDFTNRAISGGGTLIDWGVHYIDLILYCTGEPRPLTVSGEAFCKIGADIENYTYLDMWAQATKEKGGVYDVDDSVTALLRTTGPVISLHGAWAQNIGGENKKTIDFIGDKGGISLEYCGEFTYYTAKDGALLEVKPRYRKQDFYKTEIDAFVQSVRTGTPNQAQIENTIVTSRIMDAIYRSGALHREVVLDGEENEGIG